MDDATPTDARTDREILLSIEKEMINTRRSVEMIFEEAAPIIGQIAQHPMVRMLVGKVERNA
jgi:hypothetical protein